MKKKSGKIVAIVAALALVSILTVCLVACNNAENFEKRLKDKDYIVVTMTKDQIEDMVGEENANDVEWIVSGVKGEVLSGEAEMVYVVKFKSEDKAKEMENEMNSDSDGSEMKFERNGKIFIFGTEQGVKDAK